jgi:hypothetical protein
MKKTLFFILFILLVWAPLGISATDKTTVAGASLMLTDPDDEAVVINASPGVLMFYSNDVDDAAQWYSIATLHTAGNNHYATAQNTTAIWRQDQTVAEAGALPDVTNNVPTTKATAVEDVDESGNVTWNGSTSWQKL